MVAATRVYEVDVHSYVLMTNHYHLVVTASGCKVLAAAMAEINRGYAVYFNGKYDRFGPLWNGRYGAQLLDSHRYALTCLRYVEVNPLRAGIVGDAKNYPWSSYRVHAHGESSDWLTPHPCYLALGLDAPSRQSAYRNLCAVPLTDAEFPRRRRH